MGVGAMRRRHRAVFFDRDGVLNSPVVRNGKPYPPTNLDELQITPDAAADLSKLKDLGFKLYVVTNQPDVARGTQNRSVVEAIHSVLLSSLPLDGVYVCYHDDSDRCTCRKPKAGLLEQAAAENGIELHASYLIGDRWRDIDCGHAAGCFSIFLDRGYDEDLREIPQLRVQTLSAAVEAISRKEQGVSKWQSQPLSHA